MVKSSTATELTEVGQKIPYTFTVTNTGNITATGVKIVDVQKAPASNANLSDLVCDDGGNGTITLAPGEKVTCTAEYTVTKDDSRNGSVTDSASATGTTPGGDPIESDPSEKTIKKKGGGNGSVIIPIPLPGLGQRKLLPAPPFFCPHIGQRPCRTAAVTSSSVTRSSKAAGSTPSTGRSANLRETWSSWARWSQLRISTSAATNTTIRGASHCSAA